MNYLPKFSWFQPGIWQYFCLYSLQSKFSFATRQLLLCILTSFWVLRAPKSWSNYFFSAVFNLFCSFQTFFSDFTPEINKKRLKKEQK